MKKTVFFVDDSPVMRYAIEKWFKKFIKNINLICFKNYEILLEYINEPSLSLVICDHEIGSHKMTGSDFIKFMSKKRKDVSFIILSGNDPDVFNFLKDYNVKHVFQKPVDFDALKEKILEVI